MKLYRVRKIAPVPDVPLFIFENAEQLEKFLNHDLNKDSQFKVQTFVDEREAELEEKRKLEEKLKKIYPRWMKVRWMWPGGILETAE